MAGWLDSIKDTALAATVRTFLAAKLEGYGKIGSLKMDTKNRQIELELHLEGELQPVQVTLAGYEIRDNNGAAEFAALDRSFSTSRVWLTKLLNEQLAGRAFPIPEKYAKYARSLVG